ncbi:MAG: hypothetical protein N4A49_08590 [Marinifilaceae bacterium]|jgi:predicted ATP-binding protein involved in virulence|nr:hypothetical protein [Marinifilaceae bacterium]
MGKRTEKNAKSLTPKEAKNLIDLGNPENKPNDESEYYLLAYHSTARLAGEIHKKIAYQKISSRLDGYYAALDPRSIKEQAFAWFNSRR